MKLRPKKMSQRRHCGFGSCRRNRRSGSDYCRRHKHTEDIAVANPDESRTCPTTEATPEEKVASVADQATAAEADSDTTEETKSTMASGPLINPAVLDLHPIMYKKNYVPRDTSRKSLVREDGPLGKLNLNNSREQEAVEELLRLAKRLYQKIRVKSTFGPTLIRGRIDLDPWMNMTEDEWRSYRDTITKGEAKRLSALVKKVTVYILQSVNSAFGGFEDLSKSSDLAYLIAFPEPDNPNPLLYKGKNTVHRDIDSTTAPRITVELLLDNISKDSGSVVFWPHTIQYPCDKKHRGRYVETAHEKNNVKYLHEVGGEVGDVIYWDSRLLHNSIANVTDTETAKLLWYIVP